MKNSIFFKNSQKLRLRGILSEVRGLKKSPLVILCHGLASSKDGKTAAGLEKRLNRVGISTLRFDFFGHGQSQGAFEDLTVTEAVDNIFRALEVGRERGFAKIGLVGSSFGGFASLIAACETEEFAALALKAPVIEYREKNLQNLALQEQWKKQGYLHFPGPEGKTLKLNYSFAEDAEQYNGYAIASRGQVPIYIVHGEKDDVVPLEQSLKLSRIVSDRCELKVLAGVDHNFDGPGQIEEALRLITEFLVKKLR